MAIYSGLVSTVGTLIIALARQIPGAYVYDGTASSATSSTLVDASIPEDTNDGETVAGAWIYLTGGTGAGQERIIPSSSGYTASSGTISPDRNWTTTPDSTTKYLICRVRPTLLLRALQQAQRDLTQRHLMLTPVTGREHIIGNALENGAFDLYTTANTPDSWTLDSDSTFTEENTITLGARRSLKMVTDGTNAGKVSQAIAGWGRFIGKSVSLKGWMRSSIVASDRAGITLTDGVTTEAAYLSTANEWQYLETDTFTVDEAATGLTASADVTAGSAVTAYVQLLYLAEPEWNNIVNIDADRNLVMIGGLRVGERSVLRDVPVNMSEFTRGVPAGAWSIFEDVDNTPRQLRLRLPRYWMGHVLEYTGYQRTAEFTGPTVSFVGTPELILPRARYNFLRDQGENREAVRDALQEALEAERTLRVKVPGGYQTVQHA